MSQGALFKQFLKGNVLFSRNWSGDGGDTNSDAHTHTHLTLEVLTEEIQEVVVVSAH